MALTQKNREEAVTLIKGLVDFERSGISARTAQWDSEPRQGEMPDETYAKLVSDVRKAATTYVVFSYQTPIAWVLDDGSVVLPEIKYSVATSQHQAMVREAYGEWVNAARPQVNHAKSAVLKNGDLVLLTENEAIILERMRDADGTEYEMVFKGPADARQKSAPRDQLEPLYLKGLVNWLVGVDGHGEWGVALTDRGRRVWTRITAEAKAAKPNASQYSELSEDELIELAAQKADDFIHNPVMADAQELAAINLALKLRRDITAPARARVGEYLRQQAIAQAKYDAAVRSHEELVAKGYTRSSVSGKAPEGMLSEIRHDEWTGRAQLLLADLQRLVPPTMRDTEAEYFEEQGRRLEHVLRHNPKLPEKQVAVLRWIAKGYVISYGSGSYSGSPRAKSDGVEVGRIDGRVMNALKTKGLVDGLPPLGWGHSSLSRIKKPA